MPRSQAWLAVRNTHSSRLPRPLSTEHSSLYIYIPYSSSVNALCSRHQASRFAAFASVNNSLCLARQLVMPCRLRIDLIVPLLIIRSQARMTCVYVSLGYSRTGYSILRSVASEYSFGRPDRSWVLPSSPRESSFRVECTAPRDMFRRPWILVLFWPLCVSLMIFPLW